VLELKLGALVPLAELERLGIEQVGFDASLKLTDLSQPLLNGRHRVVAAVLAPLVAALAVAMVVNP